MQSHFRLAALLVLALLQWGCSGSSAASVGANAVDLSSPSVVNITASELELRPNVLVLDAGVEVVRIEDRSVTLRGAVPDLPVGTVLIKNEGDLMFERIVVSTQSVGDEVVVATQLAGLNDIVKSANMAQTEQFGGRILSQFEPGPAGLTLTPIQIQGRDVSEQPRTALRLDFKGFPLRAPFDKTVPSDAGQIFGYLDGHLDLEFGFEEAVTVIDNEVVTNDDGVGVFLAGNNTIRVVPFCRSSGDVTFRCVRAFKGSFKTELTDRPVVFELGKLGIFHRTASVQLLLSGTGTIEEGLTFRLEGGRLVDSRAGGEYTRFNGSRDKSFVEVHEVTLGGNGTLERPPLSDIDFDLRIADVEFSLNGGFLRPNVSDTRVNGQAEISFPAVTGLTVRQSAARVRLSTKLGEIQGAGWLFVMEQLAQFTANQRFTLYSNRDEALDDTPNLDGSLVFHQSSERSRQLVREPVSSENDTSMVSLTLPDLLPTGNAFTLHRGEEIQVSNLGGFVPRGTAPPPPAAGALNFAPVPNTAAGTVFSGLPPARTFRPVLASWLSSDPKVAKIGRLGKQVALKALEEGATTITCRHPFGFQTEARVVVLPAALIRIDVEPERPFSGPLPPGFDIPLVAVGVWSDGGRRDLTASAVWKVDHPEIAALNGTILSPRFPGEVTVTADIPEFPSFQGKASFTVRWPENGNYHIVPLNTQQIGVGQTLGYRVLGTLLDGAVRDLTDQSNWRVDDSSVASITQRGLALGLAPGETLISAAFRGSFFATTLRVASSPLVSLVITPVIQSGAFTQPGFGDTVVNQGGRIQYQARGTFADGSSRDVTSQVTWSSSNPAILSVDQLGVATGNTPGLVMVQATLGDQSVAQEAVVIGPVKLALTAAPPTVNLPANTPFSFTVEVQDVSSQPQTGSTAEITFALAGVPTGGTLAGTLTRSAVAGQATFDDLTIDQPGNGYVLIISSPGLSSVVTLPFNVVAPGANPVIGHIFVANDASAAQSIASLAIDATGTPTAVTNSPFAASGRCHAVERLGSLVVSADVVEPLGPCRLSILQYAAATGQLSPTAFTPSAPFAANFNPLHTASNGTDALFVVTEFDGTLHAFRFNTATGAILSTNNQGGAGTLPRELAFRPSSGAGQPDLLFVLDAGNNIRAYTYDNATGVLTPGPAPVLNPGGGGGGGLTVAGSRLYVTNQVPGNDTISAFDITLASGALGFIGTASSGAGDSGNLFRVSHPLLGDVLYCANPGDSTIGAFSINGAGLPVLLGPPVAAGDVNPHELVDLNLGGGNLALYVTTSTRLAVFLIDPTTALINAIPNSPFAGFQSPFGIAR